MWQELRIRELVDQKESYTPYEFNFLIKIGENNIEYVTKNYHRITYRRIMNQSFLISSAYTNDTKIMDYIKDVFKIDTNYMNNIKYNCLMFACAYNPNIHIIEFIVEKYQMDLYHRVEYGKNCLEVACQYNTNLDIIKYLIEGCKITVHNGSLEYCCLNNANLEIIKYLIEEKHVFIDNNCFRLACTSNPNIYVVKYLIENTKMSIPKLSFDKFVSLVPMIDNYERFNNLLSYGISDHGIDRVKNQIKDRINPLMLTYSIEDKLNIGPLSFTTYVENVLRLKCKIPVKYLNLKNKKKIYTRRYIDFTLSEALFQHNGLIYYGTKEIVYETMLLFQGIQWTTPGELPILSGKVGKDTINVYLQSCYDLTSDIDDILPDDFVNFIMFIDQYPTKTLQIDLIESEIILYLDKNNIMINDFLINISIKYQLKNLYLYCHQKTLK